MKNLYTTLVAVFAITYFSYGQNTYPWPTSGNVGIGTTSPTQRLTIPITSNAGGISLGTYSSLSAGSFAFVGITGVDGTFNSGNLTGNDNGSAGMAIIHTSGGIGNSAELAFVTHNNGVDSRERVRIDRLGNVGIGTTSPSDLFQVNNGPVMRFQVASTQGVWVNNEVNGGTSNSPGDLYLNYRSTGSTLLNSNGGNVGIGTLTPTERLDIGSGNMITTGYAEINTLAKNQIVLGSAGVNYGFVSNNTAGIWSLGYGTTPATLGTSVLSWNSGGYVGIGTTDTKGYKFAVNGSAIAESVTVKLYTAWPDYVFKPKYNLLPLTDVKKYIDKNHHLLDMPSEAEVAKNGINLGEIVKVQTKKIEELTLYLIEKDKQVESLQQQIDQLAKKINNKN